MLLNVLAKALPEGGRYVGIGESALYAVLGFLTVFLGIALLIFIVWAVGNLMHRTTGASPQPKEKKEVPKPAVKQTLVESDELSDETVAVIMATLTAYYQQTGSNCEFIVKRIKRL